VAMPSNLAIILPIASLLLVATGLRRAGLWLGGISLVVTVLLGFGPGGGLLMRPLEQRFPETAFGAAAPAGIIVLGGGVDEVATAERSEGIELGDPGERILALLALARRFPDAKLLFSGGFGGLEQSAVYSEARLVKDRIGAYGLDADKLQIESHSRNTDENARFSAIEVRPQPGQVWWLVTSAFHMPRAIGCFRSAGFDVLAYPVDFRVRAEPVWLQWHGSVTEGLRLADLAVKEWIGLAAYKLTGRIGSYFPAP